MTNAKLTGVRVMVVDDSNTIRRSAEMFLAQAGCEVTLAENGFDALGKIDGARPEVIFVDILMPRLDGYQTCALIRKSGKHGAIPIIMLSSKDSMFDRARGRIAGSDDHLTKPFTKENLLKAVERQVSRRTPGSSLAPGQASCGSRSRHSAAGVAVLKTP